MAIKPSDIELLKVGDVIYRNMRFGVGNTTMTEVSTFKVKILEILLDERGQKKFKVNWNGNYETFHAHRIESFFLFHPKPQRSCRDWFPRDLEASRKRHEEDVAEAAEKAKEERAEWRARRKAAKAVAP